MKRAGLIVSAAMLLVGCGMFDDGGEDPDDRGSRRNPVTSSNTSDDYFKLYNDVRWAHDDLVRVLNDRRNINTIRATAKLQRMRTDTKRMAMMVAEPQSSGLMRMAEKFEAVKESVRNRTWSQRTLYDLEKQVGEFTREYKPSRVVFRDRILPDTRPGNGGAKSGTRNTAADPAVGKTDMETLKRSPWMFYKAWVQVHADLIAAVGKGEEKPIRVHYARVIQMLNLIGENVEGKQRSRLARYRAEYEDAHQRTQGFTRYPQLYPKDEAIKTLNRVGDAVKLNFDPDKS